MLEAFEILTTSGVVLWSKSYAPVGPHIVNSLINDVFIEERVRPQNPGASGASPTFKKEKYTLKWKRVKDFNLIFVVRLLRRLNVLTGLTLNRRIGCLPISTSPRMDR
jgi:signal recognition particle receptor subunit alpha